MRNTFSILCTVFGHKFDYEVIKDTDEETIVDATCRRSSCDYYQRLDEEWAQIQEQELKAES